MPVFLFIFVNWSDNAYFFFYCHTFTIAYNVIKTWDPLLVKKQFSSTLVKAIGSAQ